MRTLYYLIFNHKCYVCTDLAEMTAFATFMKMEAEIKFKPNEHYYIPKIERI